MNTATKEHDRHEKYRNLIALAVFLRIQGFEARVIKPEGREAQPFCRVVNTSKADLAEHVTCKEVDGELQFMWSWGAPIAPVRHVESAAERVAYVLTPSEV